MPRHLRRRADRDAAHLSLLKPGAAISWRGDHYALLRTLEVAWGLPTLKSKAVSAAAAAKVHDGDEGVRPLTGVWLRY